MNYAESLTYLYGLGHEVLAAKFGLDSTRLLLERLGHPDKTFKSIIVAGTNGKGSTAAMIEAATRAAGYRTGLYTSPHLVRIEERIKVAGEAIPPEEFARLATEVRVAAECLVAEGTLPALPTFFEQVTLIGLLRFRDAGVELAVLEVGLGGRLDSTNAVDPLLSVITAIDFDHKDILGHEIAQIAAEKAAVIKPGSRAVIARQHHPGATSVLDKRCADVAVTPIYAGAPTVIAASEDGRLTFDYQSSQANYSELHLNLRGRHQLENVAAAIEAIELLSEFGFNVPVEAMRHGLAKVEWPGRLEVIDDRPRLLLDGAHNPAAARRLRQYVDEFCSGPITLVFGAMADKDVTGMAAELFPRASTIVLTRVHDPRAATGARMGKAALGSSKNVIFTETVRQAISWARSVTPRDGLICVAGSLHLIGEAKRALDEEDEQRVASSQ
jgi:dihydrofolate synthase/folylpolyglutamate synthase